MDTAVVFYTMSGSTKKIAQQLATQREADLIEVKEAHKRNIFTAFITGCPMALHQRASKLAAPIPELSQYSTIIIASPIWAGFPAPAFNAIVQSLPVDKNIEVVMVSSGGETPKSKELVISKIKEHGCRVTSYTDIASASSGK